MLASAGRTSSHRRVFNGSGRVGEFLSHHSYAVYIIHSPVIVALAVALRDTGLENMLKFGLVAASCWCWTEQHRGEVGAQAWVCQPCSSAARDGLSAEHMLAPALFSLVAIRLCKSHGLPERLQATRHKTPSPQM
jgi:uncharacterized membrane protein